MVFFVWAQLQWPICTLLQNKGSNYFPQTHDLLLHSKTLGRKWSSSPLHFLRRVHRPFRPATEESRLQQEMEFEKRKTATLTSLGSSVTDKSPKGSLDEPIIPLIDTINHHPSYFTTSSCSGRISILSQPKSPSKSSTKKKASGGSWVFITHDPADPDSVLPLLFPTQSTRLNPEDQPSELVLRFEPLIIAVECKNVGAAQFLVSTAIAAGFRESGITCSGDGKRVIIAIRCSIRMEVPLGDTEKLMVSPEYVRFLINIANEKMEANRKRTDGFVLAFTSNGFTDPGNHQVENGVVADYYDSQVGNYYSSTDNGGLHSG